MHAHMVSFLAKCLPLLDKATEVGNLYISTIFNYNSCTHGVNDCDVLEY